jgi:uncharacterized protein (DUF1697 family)
MEDLRAHFESLKFNNVETFIASGNVIFDSRATDSAALEQRIEKRLKQALGYDVATFLRTPTELAAIVAGCPFAEDNETSGPMVHVGFLRTAPGDDAQRKLQSLRTATDDFCVQGRELYWVCRGKVSESPFYGPLLAKTLGMPPTLRKLETVCQLVARYPAR